jgi:anti-sigma-K factor RskA
MTPARPHPHTLTGAYALHALTGPEAARFERHLARCPTCAQEIADFAETTARLADATAATPPADLKQQVLAAAARTRQLPPAIHQPTISRTRRAARPASATTLLPRRWLVLAAAVLALAAVIGLATRTTGHPPAPGQAPSRQIAAVLTAPDATMLDARITTGGTATIVMSRHAHALVFAATGLAPLPPTRCYQLWLLGPHSDTPAGMLPGPQHGPAGPITTTGLRPGTRLGLSIEPAGGSPQPTTAMILNVVL